MNIKKLFIIFAIVTLSILPFIYQNGSEADYMKETAATENITSISSDPIWP